MQLLDQNPADVFPSHKKTTFIEDTLPSSNAKTKRFESNWFTSSVYKEKVGIYSKFSQIFMHILSNSFDLFNYLYLKAKQSQEDEDFSKEYHFIYATKQIIDSSFNQINETLSIYDFRKSILLQDVTGLNYKLLSKLTSIVSELEDFLQTNNHEYEYLKKNQENQDKTLKNWFLVYSYIFKHFIETINFNLRLFDPKSNITQKLKKSSQFIIILKMLMEEMSQIFLKNQGKSLITLISNYKIQEINDLESINERLGIERIKSSSPLSAFQDFSFILSPNNLPFIESAKDKEFMCNVSNKYKKIYLFRFSEICKGDDTKKNFSIELPDYFKPKCEYKYIHYFKPFSKFLLMFDVGLIQKNINLDNGNYMKIPLNIPFDLAYESKSIITPDGEIYLSSGKFNEKGLFYPDDSFFLLDYEKLTLVPQAKMPVAKKFHAIVYLKKCIFIIGGKTKEKKCSGECEKYDIFTKKWKKITPLNEPVIYPSATAFGEK